MRHIKLLVTYSVYGLYNIDLVIIPPLRQSTLMCLNFVSLRVIIFDKCTFL